MNKIQSIVNTLNKLSNCDLLAVYDSYCDWSDDPRIHPMSEIDDWMSDKLPSEIIGSIQGEFNISDSYFECSDTLVSYESIDEAIECCVSNGMEGLAEYLADNWDSYASDIDSGIMNYIAYSVYCDFVEWAKVEDPECGEWIEDEINMEDPLTEEWEDLFEDARKNHESEENE